MGRMSIFTPAQARHASEQRNLAEAEKARQIAENTRQLIQEREEAERKFKENLERLQRESEEKYSEFVIRKNSLEQEVRDLEERRKIALSPPLIREEDIHSVEEALWARELQLRADKEDFEEKNRLLMRRLDELSGRETDCERVENRLKKQEKGIELQRNQVAQDAKRLGVQMAQFAKETTEKETELAYQDSELDARQKLLDQREQGFVEREKEIQASLRLLESQRIQLDKAWEEVTRLRKQYG